MGLHRTGRDPAGLGRSTDVQQCTTPHEIEAHEIQPDELLFGLVCRGESSPDETYAYEEIWAVIVRRRVLEILELYDHTDVAAVLFGTERLSECAARLQCSSTQVDRALRRAKYRLRTDPMIKDLWKAVPSYAE